MSSFVVTDSQIPDVKIISRKPVGDQRGSFARMFCADELCQVGFDKPVVQINHAVTSFKGTIRGMHYQLPPYAEIKLVSVLRGRIFDVAVDLRAGSPTFLQWAGMILEPKSCGALLIPEGFAHGFQTLENDCELLYLHSKAYMPSHEAGISPTDVRLAIPWPLPVSIMSDRDKNFTPLNDDFCGVRL